MSQIKTFHLISLDVKRRCLLIDIVNKVFTHLAFPDILSTMDVASRWQAADFDETMMNTVKRRLGKS